MCSFVRDSRTLEKAMVNELSVFEPLSSTVCSFITKYLFCLRRKELNIVYKRKFDYVQQSIKSSSRSANNTSAAEVMS